eukprot:9351450-Pyramimonas_sp.AAC.1
MQEGISECIAHGDSKKLKMILARGLDVNLPLNEERQTALHYSVLQQRLKAQTIKEDSPFNFPSNTQTVEIVIALLEHGADTSRRDATGKTALHIAAGAGATEVVVLRRISSDLDSILERVNDWAYKEDDKRETPHTSGRQQEAAGTRAPQLSDALDEVERYSVDGHAQTSWVNSPLQNTAKTRSIDVVRELMQHGADPNCRDDLGQTALHIAAGVGAIEIVSLLLQHSADIDAVDNNGQTSLHLAVLGDHFDVVKVLVDNKADISLTYGVYNWSPLHQACWLGHERIVQLLMQAGAEVFAVDKKSWCSLTLAAYGGRANSMETLLRNWVSPQDEKTQGVIQQVTPRPHIQ